MAACLWQSKYTDLLNFHRFVMQAAIPANIVTYNLIIKTYMDRRKADTAMEYYNELIEDAPFDPNIRTYWIIVKGLVDNDNLEKAMEMKDDMLLKGFEADLVVYSHLMYGQAKNESHDEILKLYEELKEKVGGFVHDGVVYGSDMKAYFLKVIEEDAIKWYEEALGDQAYEFKVVDISQSDSEKININMVHRCLIEHIKEAGYVPNTRDVYYDVDEEIKEDHVVSHTEKLSLCKSLLTTRVREPIRVIKSYCTCGDCHNAFKIISNVVGRLIVVCDEKRFHHFENGECSCGDFW